jgi:hypothetical protein
VQPGVSLSGGYYRNVRVPVHGQHPRDAGGFRSVRPAPPLGSRLPGGGSAQVCGLYDAPAVRRVNSVITQSDNYWKMQRVNDSSTRRSTPAARGVQSAAGDFGRSVNDAC